MKKLLALVFLLASICGPVLGDTTTTHYAFIQPNVGNTTTWGLSWNSNASSLDTNLWAASCGLTRAVNSQSSATSISLSNPLASFQSIALTAGSQFLVMAPANATSSLVVGCPVVIFNAGSLAFGIQAQDASTSILSTLAAGQYVRLWLTSSGTANGSWSIDGPYLSSVGTLFLGTTTTAANPAVNGDLTTGFYTPSSHALAATISGTETWLLNSTGESVVGNVAATNALQLTGTSAVSAGLTGIHSTTANALSLETTGIDRLTVASDGGLVAGSATGGSKGAGTFNSSGGYFVNGVGTVGSITYQTACASGCSITCTTTCTYTPNAHLLYETVELVSGGGGGGGVTGTGQGASGGGSGCYLKARLTAAQVGASQTVTMGAAGTGGDTSTGTGGNGGTTSLGSLLSCAGGSGGQAGSSSSLSGGPGGAPTISTGTRIVAYSGQQGGNGGGTLGGGGGSNIYGGGSPIHILVSSSDTGGASTGYGAGGGGAVNVNGSNVSGSDGTGGIAIFTEYNSQ